MLEDAGKGDCAVGAREDAAEVLYSWTFLVHAENSLSGCILALLGFHYVSKKSAC